MTKTNKKVVSLFITLIIMVSMIVTMFMIGGIGQNNDDQSIISYARKVTSAANAGTNGHVASNYRTDLPSSAYEINSAEKFQTFMRTAAITQAYLTANITIDRTRSSTNRNPLTQEGFVGKTLDGAGYTLTIAGTNADYVGSDSTSKDNTGIDKYTNGIKGSNMPGADTSFLRMAGGQSKGSEFNWTAPLRVLGGGSRLCAQFYYQKP